MLRYLFKFATLAIFVIFLGEDTAVSAISICEDERAMCEKNYSNLATTLDRRNFDLYRDFTRFVSKLTADTRQRRRIEKYTYEWDNLCDFMPLNEMDFFWPYQAAKWLGYNYNESIYMTFGAQYKQNLPVLNKVSDCEEALKICRESYDFILNKIIPRKITLSQQIQMVNNNGMTTILTRRAKELEQKVLNRTECPQNSPENCPFVLNCTREYQLKQQQLEEVHKQEYLQYVKYYEEQGKQLKLKERLAVLIKQNATEYSHCAIRTSSARNFTSPYEGLFYYAFKYLHASPSACTTINKNLPPITGDFMCEKMTRDCIEKLKKAKEMIEDEKRALKCFTDLVANQTAYTAVLIQLTETLEKDVQKKFTSKRCISCLDVAPCHKEYLELQKTLNDINQAIHYEYLQKFEREDQQKVNRIKIPRMLYKIRDKCDIVPVSYFKHVYPSSGCYWSNYLFGISLEQATHSFTPNFDKLPDLTQVVPVSLNCTVSVEECKKKLADGQILLTSRQIELKQLIAANSIGDNLTTLRNELESVEKRYAQYAGTFCSGPIDDEKCFENLLECQRSYNTVQERYDDGITLQHQNVLDYNELVGFSNLLKSVDSNLNNQMESRCETMQEIPKEILRRPYVAPHEDAKFYEIKQLEYLYAHGPNATTIDFNCTNLLKTCREKLTTANGLIKATKHVAKMFFDNGQGRCSVTRHIEYGIIKKSIALRELTAQNKFCFRVMENDKTITYLYNNKLN